LDVYVDESQGSVTLVDFNVFGSQTDSLLFSWQEIEALGKERNGSGDPELRTVEGDNTVRADPLAGYKVSMHGIRICKIIANTPSKKTSRTSKLTLHHPPRHPLKHQHWLETRGLKNL